MSDQTSDHVSDEEEIRAVVAVHDELYASLERADPEAMAQVWDDGDDLFCIHPGWAPLHGRSKVLRSWSAIMAGPQELHFLLTDVHVRLTGDIAVVTCTENIVSGGVPEATGLGAAFATNVLRRSAGRWRVMAHHASPLAGGEVAQGEGP